MYQITDDDIDFILEDLYKRGIKTESLRLNLLDHICIIIEENMEEGGDFLQFYTGTIKAFCQNELCELEIETNYLLYHNNLFMKKALIISGICAAAGFIAGSVGKIFLSRLTDFFLVFGFVSFVLFFLPLVFIVLLKGLRSRNDLIIYGSGTLSVILYFVCMMSKCLGLPSFNQQPNINYETGWLIMWLTGLAVGAFIFVPSYLVNGMRKPESKIPSIIVSILLIAFIGVQFRLTNLQQFRSKVNHISFNSPASVLHENAVAKNCRKIKYFQSWATLPRNFYAGGSNMNSILCINLLRPQTFHRIC